jgi:hypothetical protein
MMIDVDWRQPFIDYLSEQKVPSHKDLAEQLIRRAKSYVLVGDKLYKWGASSGVLMKCVPRQEGRDILEEIRGESGADNFRLRSDLNPNLAVMEKSFCYPCGYG